jgi:imidazolonepropionase
MLVLENVSELLTMDPTPVAGALPRGEALLAGIPKAAVLIDDERIVWLGPESERPAIPAGAAQVIDCHAGVVTPGWVECHSHVIYGGDRAADFDRRSRGLSYEQITAEGGGIQTTVDATRGASLDALVAAALPRIERLERHGATLIEIKSGYGLELAAELRMLEAIRRLDALVSADLVATFLGAHLVPREYRGDRDGYLSLVIEEMLPVVAERGLAEFVDVFCEEGAFSIEESRRVLEAARALGLKTKVHAEQLTSSGATAMACALGATSVDHLDHINADDIALLAASSTVPVALPGATLFLGKSSYPPGRALADAGKVPALSTDYNPGSAHTANLPLMTTLACTNMGLSPAEALYGVTRAAAAALDRSDRAGLLRVGGPADLVLFDLPSYTHIPYDFGGNPVKRVMKGGQGIV